MKHVFSLATAFALAFSLAGPAAATGTMHSMSMGSTHASYSSHPMMMRCPHGKHLVKGYVRKNGTRVAAYCR